MKLAAMLSLSAITLAGVGCGSNNDGPVGGPVMGAVDTHCGDTKEAVGACVPIGTPIDAGAADGGTGGGGSDFGGPMFNNEASDDDCKYHVAWSSTPVRRNADVTFNLTLTKLTDGSAATGADPTIEAFLTDTHPTPSVDIASTETPNVGKYSVGKVRFDASGMWTVRFHFYESCSDVSADSPHGHAAFFVNVP